MVMGVWLLSSEILRRPQQSSDHRLTNSVRPQSESHEGVGEDPGPWP